MKQACIPVFAPVTCLLLHVETISSKYIGRLAGPAAIFNWKTRTCTEEDPRPLPPPAFAPGDPPSADWTVGFSVPPSPALIFFFRVVSIHFTFIIVCQSAERGIIVGRDPAAVSATGC